MRAAASHTGSLAGDSAVFDAALRQSGAVSARGLDEMIDLEVGFGAPFLPAGNRLGILVEAGGSGVAASDAAEGLGLTIPTLSPGVQREIEKKLKGIVPPFSPPRNPVDLVWTPVEYMLEPFVQCIRLVAPEVDAIIMVSYAVLDDTVVKSLTSLRDEIRKPIFLVPGHASESREGMRLLTRSGIPAFSVPERALKALSAMARYAQYRAGS